MASDLSATDWQQRWQEFVSRAEQPEWVREMNEHYWRTGTVRPEDLWRLLGDPTKGVEVGPNTSLASLLAAQQNRTC
jgi:hypothetical protein